VDHLGATSFDATAIPVPVDGLDLPDNLLGLDVGAKTLAKYEDAQGDDRH
jgi:hypothetical protein